MLIHNNSNNSNNPRLASMASRIPTIYRLVVDPCPRKATTSLPRHTIQQVVLCFLTVWKSVNSRSHRKAGSMNILNSNTHRKSSYDNHCSLPHRGLVVVLTRLPAQTPGPQNLRYKRSWTSILSIYLSLHVSMSTHTHRTCSTIGHWLPLVQCFCFVGRDPHECLSVQVVIIVVVFMALLACARL
jgi:hypothetical protein